MPRKLSLDSTSVLAQFLKKKRTRMVFLGIALIFLLSISGLFLQKKQQVETEQTVMPKSVELKVGQKKGSEERGENGVQKESFVLRPLPDELLQQFASMENLNESAADAKFTGMRVLWPVYYFANQDMGGGKTNLLLDVSEDGFGVLIESEVELSAYPAIPTLQAGQKMWIGGEILAVDPSGTGTIHLKAEHLQFSEEQQFQAGQVQAN